jgi:hypothetical protein
MLKYFPMAQIDGGGHLLTLQLSLLFIQDSVDIVLLDISLRERCRGGRKKYKKKRGAYNNNI